MLSGQLRGRHEVRVDDAIVHPRAPAKVHEGIRRYRPDAIVSLACSASWAEDAAFFRATRRYTDAPILLSGDFPRAAPQRVLDACDAVAGAIVDFSECDVAAFVDGARTKLANIHTRESAPVATPPGRTFAYGVPQHERFPLARYHHPLISRHPYTTVITDFSCPFHCVFCSYERIPYKRRDLANVEAELKHVHALGVRQLLINDAAFGASAERGRQLCEMLRGFRGGFRWICDMRVDHADPDLLGRMKRAGCELVMFGVETPTAAVLEATRKGITVARIREAFRAAKAQRLRTLAHFIMGLDGETWASQLRLIDFALELSPDYAAFGLASPAWDTTFRDRIVDKGRIAPDATGFDVSASRPLWDSDHLDRAQVEALHALAIRRFYLRPSYVLERLLSIRSPYEARNLVVQALHLAGG